MDQHDSPSGFVPDAYDRPGRQVAANIISPLRSRWRVPAVATSVSVVAALCLYAGSGARASAADTASKSAATSLAVHSAVDAGANTASLKGHVEAAADAPSGGVHGALNVYDGPGGGVEFWFNPGTGDLTVAVSAGVGEGGGGVLGTYVGTPEPGTYLYATADFAAGTVATVNLLGTYSFNNGVFAGQVSTTVAGRTVTITSDGTSTFDASVYAAEGAAGFTGAVGIQHVYSFNVLDVIEYIWDSIKGLLTGDYSLLDSDDTGDTTVAYADDSSTDDTDLTTDDSSSDDSTTSDDSSSDDASSDSGDSDSGGGGGAGDDSDAPIDAESLALVHHADLP